MEYAKKKDDNKKKKKKENEDYHKSIGAELNMNHCHCHCRHHSHRYEKGRETGIVRVMCAMILHVYYLDNYWYFIEHDIS